MKSLRLARQFSEALFLLKLHGIITYSEMEKGEKRLLKWEAERGIQRIDKKNLSTGGTP